VNTLQQFHTTVKHTHVRKYQEQTLLNSYRAVTAIPLFYMCPKEQIRIMKMMKIYFLRAVAGYRTMNHKRKEDTEDEMRKTDLNMRGPVEKFVDWRQCAAVMRREAATIMQSCSGGSNVVVA
jgi:hypothetical protein